MCAEEEKKEKGGKRVEWTYGELDGTSQWDGRGDEGDGAEPTVVVPRPRWPR
jgi:hypothetical protein